MADDTVELRVGGQIFSGWEGVAVTRSMEAACGTYNLTVTDRWAGQEQPWPIHNGDTCEVRLEGETVITGYVDAWQPGFSADSHTISVQGRDKSADMVDCAAVHKPDEWRNLTVLALGNILAKPFGISVHADTDVGAPIPLVKLQHGETALEALLRYARMRKLLVMPDGKGALVLTRTGNTRAAVQLVQGQNILSASGNLDWSERFSEYIVKGQGIFSLESDGGAEAHVFATVTDPGMPRYRPLIIQADECGNSPAAAKDRATWEANTRIGKATQATLTVQGWRQTPGDALWQPNMLVRVTAPWLRLDGDMLIHQVTFHKGEQGTTTDLDIASPQAYQPEPPKPVKTSGGDWAAAIAADKKGG